MNLHKNLNYFFILPALLSVVAILSLAMWGLKPGIDLSGGSLMQVSYAGARPPVSQVLTIAAPLGLGEVRAQPAGEDGYIIHTRALSTGEHQQLLAVLGGLGSVTEQQFTTVGPTIGTELLHKAYIAIALVVLCIILFIAFAFRGVSKPVASWKYGVVAVVTLLHDILIPAGLFAILCRYAGAEVDSLFIVALLTILGVSINDTIVVFDRIRENLKRNDSSGRREEFATTVGHSITQTLARSINTSLTVVVVLIALYVLGPAATKTFALTLIVGMIAGTYSSIFLAAPLLVVWQRWQKK